MYSAKPFVLWHSVFLALEQGCPPFSDKWQQPLLLVGSKAALVKYTSSGIPYCLNYCITPGLEYEIGSMSTGGGTCENNVFCYAE